MDKLSKTILFSCFLITCLSNSLYAQDCSNYIFSNSVTYTECNALPVLNSFLHWNYQASNQTVDIAYRHTGMTTNNWIVWALNPTGTRMIGAQCLVAFQNSSGQIHAYTSPISTNANTGYRTTLQEAPLSFDVSRIVAEFVGDQMIIYATITLPSGGTSFSHAWQFGTVSGNSVQSHQQSGDNMRSFGTIDFASGRTVNTGASSGGSRERNRNIHGVLNVVSWGIMMPLGVIMARYLKVFKFANPAWFYVHVTCQSSGYIVGVAGWATGLRLGSDSLGIQHNTHRNIGITIFVLGTLQVFALLLRLKPEHKYRLYWNIYHHMTGYTVIILSIVNIFEGFEILVPEEGWRRAYIGILIFLGACVVVLEPLTWYIVLKKKKQSDKYPDVNTSNGMNGARVNGYGHDNSA